MTRAICPSCQDEIGLPDHLRVGQRVSCHNCAEKLIVIHLKPVELEWSDGGDWEEGEVIGAGKATRTRRKGAFDPHDSFRDEYRDWESDDADRRMKSRRNKKKKMRGQRDGRRRRYGRDEFYEDF